MKVAVHWSGGKECCLAYHRAMEQGHDVAYLITYVYAEPYFFHSLPIMELQSKTLGTPHITVKIKNPKDSYDEIFDTLNRLNREDGVKGIVVGDIVGAGCARAHQVYYEIMCQKLGMNLLMPLENPHHNTYEVLKEEISAGLKPIMSCINLDYFGEEWLGRELNMASIKELKALADKQEIDVCSEDGRSYHTEVLDAPLFKDSIEIDEFDKKINKEKRKWGERSWLYMDVKEASLKPKK